MPSIYLIRHGQASFGKADYDCLSELGSTQAAHLGQAFTKRGLQFDHVIVGGMNRHQQTAKACLQALTQDSMSVQTDELWNEYDHQDILSQLSPEYSDPKGIMAYVSAQTNPKQALDTLINQAFERWIAGQHDEQYRESWTAYQERVHLAFSKLIANNNSAKHIGVFTSGGPIALLSQHFLGVPSDKLMQLNWTLVNCGVTKLLSSVHKTSLSSLNEHSFFEGKYKHLLSYK